MPSARGELLSKHDNRLVNLSTVTYMIQSEVPVDEIVCFIVLFAAHARLAGLTRTEAQKRDYQQHVFSRGPIE